MRISKITVTNLFGVFNHEIPLNLDEHITIIHGPNGYGKTVILGMLHSFFNSRYQQIRRVRFEAFEIEMDDGNTLKITNTLRSAQEGADAATSLEVHLTPREGKGQTYRVKPITREDVSFPIRMLEREIPGLEQIGQEMWLYEPTQERLALDEVLERFGERLTHSRKLPEEPHWLSAIKGAVNTRFIETQRLLSFSPSRRSREFQVGFDRRLPLVPAVTKYSDELASAIQSKLTEYAALSQSLDRSFPTRLVKRARSSDLTVKELGKNLGLLEDKRTQLMDAGLLDREAEVDLSDLQNVDESNRNVLTVYIEDVSKKLAVFDELTNRIDLMVRVINNRFTYKKMSVDKKNGFVFQTPDSEDLPTTVLSSGEQHELVLFYELLFKVTPNTLILIDEPELSLHVLWQQQFLEDLQEVTRLSGFDVLFATHSPQIIHDRWDLTVDLRGPDDAQPSDEE